MNWSNEQVKPDELINPLAFEDVKYEREFQKKKSLFFSYHKHIQD